MCEPVSISLGIAALATAAAGAGVSAYAAHQQGQNAQDVANYNAKVDEQQAKQAETLGNQQEQLQMQKTRQFIARERAGMASSGVVADSGSFGNVEDTTNFMGATDALTIRANAAKEAWGYRTNADMSRFQGASAAQAGNFGMVGSLLTGATQTFGMMMQNKKTAGSVWG